MCFAFSGNANAFDLDKIKACFISGDYKCSIREGEKLLASNTHGANQDELYYILGLSYLKDGNYLRASDIFEIILKEFKRSRLKEEAMLGLVDSDFLRGDLEKAKAGYSDLLKAFPESRYAPQISARLGLVESKEVASGARDSAFAIQVGSFSREKNALGLSNELRRKEYDAYVENSYKDGNQIFRVKIGNIKSRAEAEQLEQKLAAEGYPTKIIPQARQ